MSDIMQIPSSQVVRANLPRMPPMEHQRLLIGMALAAFAIISALSVVFSEEAAWVLLIPLISIGLIFTLWIIKQAISGSPGAIMAYLAIIAFITDAQFRARGAGEIGTDWQSLLKFAVWTGAGVIGFAHMPPVSKLLGRTGSACWLIYILIAIISSVYAPTPVYSFGCAFSLLCFFAFAFALTTKLTESQFLWTLTVTLSIFLLIGWVVYKVNPKLGSSEFWTYGGIELRMCGIAGQANNLGAVCAKFVGAVFLLWAGGRGRLLVILPLAALGVATLIASDARTGMIAVAVAIVGAVLARSFSGLVASALAAVSGLIVYLVFSFHLDALGGQLSRSGDPTEVFTLTGRLEIWDFVWQKILEQPALGWGYNASKVLLPNYIGFQDGLMVDTAHNMLLQSLLSVGILGTFPIIALIFFLMYNLVARPNRFRDLFLIIILVSGISDTSALGTTPTVLTLLFLMISVLPQAPLRNLGPAPVIGGAPYRQALRGPEKPQGLLA